MGEFSIWHWLIVLLVVMLLFGSGKVSGLMGDFAKGIKSFKKNMADDDQAPAEPAASDKPAGSNSGPAGEAAPREATARETVPHEAKQRETTPAH